MPISEEPIYCSRCGNSCRRDDFVCRNCGHALSQTNGGNLSNDEAAALLAELIESASFVDICQRRPDEALSKIARFLNSVPEMEDNCAILVYKFCALGQKALIAAEEGTPATQIQALCENSLREYMRARGAARTEPHFDNVITHLHHHLDQVAIALEKHVPAGVQRVMGETKLKYVQYAGRVFALNHVSNTLTQTDLDEIHELTVTAPFPIKAALVGSVIDTGNARWVNIPLYDTPEVWGAFDKMNPIRGQLTVAKDKSPGSRWLIRTLRESTPTPLADQSEITSHSRKTEPMSRRASVVLLLASLWLFYSCSSSHGVEKMLFGYPGMVVFALLALFAGYQLFASRM